jgi:hypothetical protein
MATTFMDTDKMKNVSNGFDGVSNVLKVVSMALEAAMMALKAAAFISFGATLWMERYLANIKPKVDNLAKKTHEISEDINKAIQMHTAASQAGNSI